MNSRRRHSKDLGEGVLPYGFIPINFLVATRERVRSTLRGYRFVVHQHGLHGSSFERFGIPWSFN